MEKIWRSVNGPPRIVDSRRRGGHSGAIVPNGALYSWPTNGFEENGLQKGK